MSELKTHPPYNWIQIHVDDTRMNSTGRWHTHPFECTVSSYEDGDHINYPEFESEILSTLAITFRADPRYTITLNGVYDCINDNLALAMNEVCAQIGFLNMDDCRKCEDAMRITFGDLVHDFTKDV